MKRSSSFIWLIDAVCAVVLAAAIAYAVQLVLDARATGAGAHRLLPVLLGLCAVAAARAMAQIYAVHAGQHDARAAKAGWRALIWPAVLKSAPGDRTMLGEAVSDAVDRIEDLDGYHANFRPLRFAAVAAPLMIAVAAAPASIIASVIMLGTLVPFALGMALAGTAAARAARRQMAALGRLSGLFVDRVRALPVIVGFGAQERVGRHLADATRDVAERTISVLRIAFLSSAVMEFFAALSVALVAMYCGFNLLGLLPFPAPETLTLGEALFVLVLAPEFYMPMRRLAAAYHDKQTGEAAMERLRAWEPARQDGDAAGDAPVVAPAAPVTSATTLSPAPESAAPGLRAPELGVPELRFDEVVIAYEDMSIGPFSFTAQAGAMTAICAPSGFGKSSLLHAVLGLAPVAGGRLLVNGRADALAALPGHIGWAGQAIAFIPGSLGDNIRLARPEAAAAEVERVARLVGLGRVMDARGEGLAFLLDHHGSGLSGGERRRIALARVLLKDAPLWLLDEPTADLDAASAAEIGAMLRREGRGRTLVLATHNEGLAALADHKVMLS